MYFSQKTYDALHKKRALIQFVDNAGPDQPAHQADLGLHCPLTESMDTVVYVDEQRMSRSDCTDEAHSSGPSLFTCGTVNPFYTDTRYNDKICYNDNLNITKLSLKR